MLCGLKCEKFHHVIDSRGGNGVVRFIARAVVKDDAESGYLREGFHGSDSDSIWEGGYLRLGHFERFERQIVGDLGWTSRADAP